MLSLATRAALETLNLARMRRSLPAFLESNRKGRAFPLIMAAKPRLRAYLIFFKLPCPLTWRLPATCSAFANARRKFSPSTFRISCSV